MPGVDASTIARAKAAGYSDQQIVEHLAASMPDQIGTARTAGYNDAEIVAHLAKAPAQAAPKAAAFNPQALRPQDAQTALQGGSADLERQIAGLTPAQQAFARRKFASDQRVTAIQGRTQAPQATDPISGQFYGGTGAQGGTVGGGNALTSTPRKAPAQGAEPSMGAEALNIGAGLLQGPLGAADIPLDMIGGIKSGVNALVMGATSPIAHAILPEKNAQAWDRAGAATERNIAAGQNMLVKGVERLAPTPNDPVSQGVRTAAQFAGGLFTPMGGPSKAPIRAPAAAKAATQTARSGAAEAIQAGRQAGVRVLTSDVRPPKTALGKLTRNVGENIPWAGTGGVRAKQQAERIDAIRTLVKNSGVGAEDIPDNLIVGIAKDLGDTRAAALTKYSTMKRSVIDGLQGSVPVPNTITAIDKKIAELSKMGTSGAGQVVAKLQNWRAAIQEATDTVSTGVLDASGNSITRTVTPHTKDLHTIDLIRSEMGTAFSTPEMGNIRDIGEKALSSIYGPMKADMGAFIQKTGGTESLRRWTVADGQLSPMIRELDQTAFRRALNSTEMTPEAVGRLLFSKDPSTVRRVVSNLSAAGRAKAQSAVISRAFEKAGGFDVLDEKLSAEVFSNKIKDMGGNIGVIFQPGDQERLMGMHRLLEYTRQASAANATLNTGARNTPLIAGMTMGSVAGPLAFPLAGLGGLAARAYESAPVRNLLLGLNRAPKGSPQETEAVRRLVVAISAIAERNPGLLNDNVGVRAAAGQGPEQQQEQQPPLQP